MKERIVNMVKKVKEHLTEGTYKTYIYLLVIFGVLIIFISIKIGYFGKEDFFKGVLVESYGMLFDILVIGIIFHYFFNRGEIIKKIERYKEEIDDMRGWRSDYAKNRILGIAKRLNNLNINKINFTECYLHKAYFSYKGIKNLEGSKFNRANLSYANFIGVNLRGCDFSHADFKNSYLQENISNLKYYLKDADFSHCDLTGVHITTSEQFSVVKTLYMARLSSELEQELKSKYSHLFEKPKDEEPL